MDEARLFNFLKEIEAKLERIAKALERLSGASSPAAVSPVPTSKRDILARHQENEFEGQSGEEDA
jgi:hypothetical protein